MKQFTMNIDEALLRAAKKHALDRGRTVSDIIRETLAREVGWSPRAPKRPADDASALSALLGYSVGNLSRRQAMEAMGLEPDRYSEFVDAMIRAKTPWPPVDRARVEREADFVAQAISEAFGED